MKRSAVHQDRAAGLRTLADPVSVSHADDARHIAHILPHTDVLVLPE